jgi:cytochrome c556
MAEETPEEKAAREQREAAAKKPPWGEDKDFDAERAWKLITDLRADNTKVRGERDALQTQVKEHEDATKTEKEKLAESATGAETRATTAEREAARLRIALKKGLTETQAKRLVGDDEAALEADADQLLADFTPSGSEGNGETRRRPQERLRPGATPSAEPEETDPRKLAASVPDY